MNNGMKNKDATEHGTEHAHITARNRRFQAMPLQVLVTAAEGMHAQGNIQGLEMQHQLVHDIRPEDLRKFGTEIKLRGVAHDFNSATFDQRMTSFPTCHRRAA